MRFCIVAPAPQGTPSGGDLYNAYLAGQLRALGAHVEVLHGLQALPELREEPRSLVLVDSLFLHHWEEIRSGATPAHGDATATRFFLLLHYLPSLLLWERACNFHELSADERRALTTADGIICTGKFLSEMLKAQREIRAPIHLAQPGDLPPGFNEEASSHRERRRAASVPKGVLVGNLTEPKGVLPFLRALDQHTSPGDLYTLDVVGSATLDLEYARECQTLISASGVLCSRVKLLGGCAHERTLQVMAEADIFISASRMETHGMALGEARALGLILLALDAGNAREHTRSELGGELAPDAPGLAQKFLDLVREPQALAERQRLTRRSGVPRTYESTAREVLAAVGWSGHT